MTGPGVDGPVWIPSLPPSLEQFLAPNLQPLPVLPILGLIVAAAYLAGAIRLWTRGYRWSWIRTACFLLGSALLVVITGAGIEGYGLRMFSVFMLQQLTLMMVIPPLLLLGSPGTLLLRATPHRGIGRLTLQAALGCLRSRAAKFALHPVLVIPLMVLSLFGLYLSGAANVLLRSWIGHVSLEALFLFVGILIAAPLVSADPLPRRTSYVSRLFDAFVEMQLHAGFGLVLTLSVAPVVAFFSDAPAAWNVDPVRDQWMAGALAWTYGEVPLLVLLIVTLVRWQRQDTTRAVRAQDRTDAEMEEYNEYLRGLHSPRSSA
ncbi:cytochrome c oxidase assembly protein [Cryobacterium zhongshanensis]|uniref:Cytochrome c oxidase assembly protein n=1 Tax=Cryobacterium zhongshanensis TaxID=2928153 RepID=A0AA41UFC9_9MICO|nr:cytochrome c oxidase assembly protein [Cryobacterium zhongshanensis]MCI4658463.1 cytochrome c oxidase assembly protein [Cryobacterium zhongshanensis]